MYVHRETSVFSVHIIIIIMLMNDINFQNKSLLNSYTMYSIMVIPASTMKILKNAI